MLTKFRYHWLAWTTALAFGLSACSDSTGPTGPFEPTLDAAAVNDVETDLALNPALASMSLVRRALSGFPIGSLQLSRLTLEPSTSEGLRAQMSAVASALALAEVIPRDLRGTTYEYNPEAGQYEQTHRTGAPSNGVRYILYLHERDAITFQLVLPLVEIGYVDFIDRSSLTTDRLRVVATLDLEGDGTYVTCVDYTISRSESQSAAVGDVVGFVTDGTHRVNLAVRSEVDYVGADSSADIVLDAVTRGVRLSLSYDELYDSDIGAWERNVFVYEIRTARGTIRFTFTITPAFPQTTLLTGEIRHNGRVVVTISGGGDSVIFRKTDGTDLTLEEFVALHELFEGPDALFRLFDIVLAPLDGFGL